MEAEVTDSARVDVLRGMNKALHDELDSEIERGDRMAELLSGWAGKLLRKGKFFLCVAEDEPYFLDVFRMIRKREQEIGCWTEEDDKTYHAACDPLVWHAYCREVHDSGR